MAGSRLSADGDHAALPGSDRRAESAARRGDRDESRGDSHRRRAGCRAQPGSRARAAAWHPRADQGQHRHRDSMQTTAGSLALVGSRVPRDAPIVEGLRTAGAIILGKANLSEWANFRGFRSTNGWSARGGFTRNPYDLSLDPSGSSSGSAVAVAANLTAIAVGTETDGSITSPAAENAIVGLKPTRRPRVAGGHHPHRPLAGHGGPDVPDGDRCRAAARRPALAVRRGSGSPRHDYSACLDAGALEGVRLAYDRRYADGELGPRDDDLLAVVERALEEMRAAGAVIDEITTADPTTPGADGRVPFDDELLVMLFEIKVHMAEYLEGLGQTDLRTLADLIAFNRAHRRGGGAVLRAGALRARRGDGRRPHRSGVPGRVEANRELRPQRHRRRAGAGLSRGADSEQQPRHEQCRDRRLSEHLGAGRADGGRPAGRAVDGRGVPAGAGAARPGLRDRAVAGRAQAAADARNTTTRAARRRSPRRARRGPATSAPRSLPCAASA